MAVRKVQALAVEVGHRILVEPADEHSYEAQVIGKRPSTKVPGMLLLRCRRPRHPDFTYQIPLLGPVEVRNW